MVRLDVNFSICSHRLESIEKLWHFKDSAFEVISTQDTRFLMTNVSLSESVSTDIKFDTVIFFISS